MIGRGGTKPCDRLNRYQLKVVVWLKMYRILRKAQYWTNSPENWIFSWQSAVAFGPDRLWKLLQREWDLWAINPEKFFHWHEEFLWIWIRVLTLDYLCGYYMSCHKSSTASHYKMKHATLQTSERKHPQQYTPERACQWASSERTHPPRSPQYTAPCLLDSSLVLLLGMLADTAVG